VEEALCLSKLDLHLPLLGLLLELHLLALLHLLHDLLGCAGRLAGRETGADGGHSGLRLRLWFFGVGVVVGVG